MELTNILNVEVDMQNRLKLYDDKIWTYIEHKDKVKFRSIAFKNKRTTSDLNRMLIKLFIKLYDANKLNKKNNDNDDYLEIILQEIGGMLNK